MTDVHFLREQVRELQEEVELQREVIMELREELDTANRDVIVMGQAIKHGKLEHLIS